MKVIIAIENSLIRLDVLDTLRNLGIENVRGVSTAVQALAAVGKESCDVVIFGLENVNAECQRLIDALLLLRIPIVMVSSGISVAEILSRQVPVEILSVPFDSGSLHAALERALRGALKRLGGS